MEHPAPYAAKAREPKILYFEGLRGLLALVVFIHHFILLFYPAVYIGTFDRQEFIADPYAFKILLAHSPLNIFMSGHLAVCMFLVISGYVLTVSYKLSGTTYTLQHNILKRYFRLIFPVLGACLFLKILFACGIIELANYPRNIEKLEFGNKLFRSDLTFPSLLITSLFSVPLSGHSNFLPVLWTVKAEFLGVLALFSFLIITHHLRGRFYYAVVLISGYLYFSQFLFILLIAGGLICVYEEKIKKAFVLRISKVFLLCLALFCGGMLNTNREATSYSIYAFTLKFPFQVYPLFHNLAAIFFLILLISSTTLKRLFSYNYLVLFGKLCFSIYLLHLPVLYCLGSCLMRIYRGQIHPLWLFSLCFCATTLLAIPFYKYVDKAAIRFSNRFATRLMFTT